MVVVVRLQGLNTDAGLEDIRAFFHGLQIPKAGVHITGGTTGEAFIIFITQKDAHVAMQKSGRLLKGSPVTLSISSLVELTQKMKVMVSKWKVPTTVESEHAAGNPPTELRKAVLLGEMAAIQSPNHQDSRCPSPTVDSLPLANRATCHVDQQASQIKNEPDGRHKGPSDLPSKPGYLRLYGLPSTITDVEVREFLDGSSVEDVIVNAFHGSDRCCLVKMASFEEALKYTNRKFKHCTVKTRLAHERMWTNAKEGGENSPCSSFLGQKRSSPGTHRSNSGSPKRCHLDSPFGSEFCVMVKNLPINTTKTELKQLFSCPTIPNNKVIHLLNKWRDRTSTSFIIFTNPEEYASAMNMNGSHFNSSVIEVSSITKDKMNDLKRQNRQTEPSTSQFYEQADSGLCCIYARNFPANVKRADVKGFFCSYDLCENEIELLEDENGNGIGEAVIQFGSEEHARKAHNLHGKLFMGEQILLTCISPQQMKDVLNKPR